MGSSVPPARPTRVKSMWAKAMIGCLRAPFPGRHEGSPQARTVVGPIPAMRGETGSVTEGTTARRAVATGRRRAPRCRSSPAGSQPHAPQARHGGGDYRHAAALNYLVSVPAGSGNVPDGGVVNVGCVRKLWWGLQLADLGGRGPRRLAGRRRVRLVAGPSTDHFEPDESGQGEDEPGRRQGSGPLRLAVLYRLGFIGLGSTPHAGP